MKHAYLIMAHANIGQLSQLLLALDDPRNDIYLHIDAKSDIDLTQLAPPQFANAVFLYRVLPQGRCKMGACQPGGGRVGAV